LIGMSETNTLSRPELGYEADFYAWTQQQAEQLRSLRPTGFDWAHLAEEIEDLGKSQKQKIESNLTIVLLHLLKLAYQQRSTKAGWRSSVIEHRRRIARIVRDSPSLRRYPATVLHEEYAAAREMAADETGLAFEAFPETCPFTIEEVLDYDVWPEAGTGAWQ
jgi:hypothetical protein